MTLGAFVGGVALLTLAVAPLTIAAVAARARLLPSWRGPIARVAELVLVVGALTAVDEVLGVAGLFDRWAVVLSCAAVGAVAASLLRRQPAAPDAEGVAAPPDRRGIAVAGAASALVGLQWLAPSLAALRGGMQGSIDTLWYHGPTAARFVQQGTITPVHFFDDNAVTAYFPSGTALLHATGIVTVGNDVLSPLVNLVFLALAITAAWCIGARWRNGPAGVLAVVAVLGTPTLVTTQPGGDYNDVVGMALVLAAVALLLAGEAWGAPLALAAVAAGLAIGVKLTMIPPVAALTVGVVVVNRRRWRTAAGAWAAGLGAMGGLWYVRNVVAAESPLPGPGVALGPLRLHRLPSTTPIETVARYLGSGRVLRRVYVPGLSRALGPAWPALLLGGVGGGVAVAWRAKDRLARLIGAAGVVSFLAYLVTPQYLGSAGNPIFFAVNVRYCLTALALGLVALPALPSLATPRGRAGLVAALVAVVALNQLRVGDLWGAGAGDTLRAVAVLVLAAIVGVLARRASTARRLAIGALCAVALVGGVWFVQRHVVETRYTSGYFRQPVLAALVHQRGVRIATEGFFLQYPLYGPDLANHVAYVGERRPHGGFAPFRSCRRWVASINAGRYDYLLVASTSYPATSNHVPALDWAHAQYHVLHQLASDGSRAATFRVGGRLDPSVCPS